MPLSARVPALYATHAWRLFLSVWSGFSGLLALHAISIFFDVLASFFVGVVLTHAPPVPRQAASTKGTFGVCGLRLMYYAVFTQSASKPGVVSICKCFTDTLRSTTVKKGQARITMSPLMNRPCALHPARLRPRVVLLCLPAVAPD